MMAKPIKLHKKDDDAVIEFISVNPQCIAVNHTENLDFYWNGEEIESVSIMNSV